MKRKKSLQSHSPQTLLSLFTDNYVIFVFCHLLAVSELDNDLTAQVFNYCSLCLSLSWVKQGAKATDNAFQLFKIYHSHSLLVSQK